MKKQLSYDDTSSDSEEEDFLYVALSYRWGELDEQLVAGSDEYHAHVTSFQLSQFYDLCKSISLEPDMAHISYVWVDAICVDQENRERRKATIYRMNDIYKCATWIIAVPDLHSFYLSISSSANNETMKTIKKHQVYLYHLLRGSQHTLVELDEAWMDEIGISSSDELRRNLTGYTNLAVQDIMKMDFQGADPTVLMNQMVSSLFIANQATLKDTVEDPSQLVFSHFVKELCRDEFKRKIQKRQKEIIDAMDFLQTLMEEWSNRTWVISEYHIAKRKKGIMKFWFTLLGCSDLHGLPFFEFDFKYQTPTSDSPIKDTTADQCPFTRRIIYRTRRFKGSMRRRLLKRSFLEMMLETKASNNEDRFHSILPLTPKYKHHIMDGDTIADWGITDKLSVRLKLLEWIDTRDQLTLLISCTPPMSTPPLLPSFATCMRSIKHGFSKYLHALPPDSCNFDLGILPSVGVSKIGGGITRLCVRPKVYYVPSTRKPTRQYYQEIGLSSRIWGILGLDKEKDALVGISIPLFLNPTITHDPTNDRLLRSDFQLVGNWEKNIWICYRFCSNYKDCKIYPSVAHLTDPQQGGFHIY